MSPRARSVAGVQCCTNTLSAVRAGKRTEASVFVREDEFFVYQAKLRRAKNSRHQGHRIELNLWAVADRNDEIFRLVSWEAPPNGEAREVWLEYPLAAFDVGRWRLLIESGQEMLAQNEFALHSGETFCKAVELEGIWFKEGKGRERSIDVVTLTDRTALSPVIALQAPCPCSSYAFPASLIVKVDEVFEWKWKASATFHAPSLKIEAASFPLPERKSLSAPLNLGFFVFLNNRFIGQQTIRVYAGHGPVADVEGRLLPGFEDSSVDLKSEADRIRREAGIA